MASRRVLVVALSFVLVTSFSSAADWPHWRGPNRNGITSETSRWDGGKWPPRDAAWSAAVGIGSTSPLVVGGALYTLGWNGGRDTVVCLDATTGKPRWSQSYACPRHGRHATGDEGLYAGPTATPEFDTETRLLYTLSCDGHLHCWETTSGGTKVWGLNLYERYGVPQRKKLTRTGLRDYGYTAAPYVHGDWLIVEVGDDEGNLFAFDKRTGERRWTSESKDPAGHAGGPAPMTVDGTACLAVLTQKNLLVVRIDEGHAGKTVAEFPWVTDYANSIAGPAVSGDRVVITSGYNNEAIVGLRISKRGAEKVWEQRPLHSKICTPVIHDDRVYWAWESVHCLDLATGKPLWDSKERLGDAGSCVVTADDRLITWTGRGRLALYETAKRSPSKATKLAETGPLFRTEVWPHVVLAEGRLYCKDRDGKVMCLPLE